MRRVLQILMAIGLLAAVSAQPARPDDGSILCVADDISGTATGGSATTLVDTSPGAPYASGWPTNVFRDQVDDGHTATLILRPGTGSEESLAIASNTSDTITVYGSWSTAPANGDAYTIDTDLRLHPNGPCGTATGQSAPADGQTVRIVDAASRTACGGASACVDSASGGGDQTELCQWDPDQGTSGQWCDVGDGAPDAEALNSALTSDQVLAGDGAGGLTAKTIGSAFTGSADPNGNQACNTLQDTYRQDPDATAGNGDEQFWFCTQTGTASTSTWEHADESLHLVFYGFAASGLDDLNFIGFDGQITPGASRFAPTYLPAGSHRLVSATVTVQAAETDTTAKCIVVGRDQTGGSDLFSVPVGGSDSSMDASGDQKVVCASGCDVSLTETTFAQGTRIETRLEAESAGSCTEFSGGLRVDWRFH